MLRYFVSVFSSETVKFLLLVCLSVFPGQMSLSSPWLSLWFACRPQTRRDNRRQPIDLLSVSPSALRLKLHVWKIVTEKMAAVIRMQHVVERWEEAGGLFVLHPDPPVIISDSTRYTRVKVTSDHRKKEQMSAEVLDVFPSVTLCEHSSSVRFRCMKLLVSQSVSVVSLWYQQMEKRLYGVNAAACSRVQPSAIRQIFALCVWCGNGFKRSGSAASCVTALLSNNKRDFLIRFFLFSFQTS